MSDPTEPNALLLLGEIRGQLRELIHTGNNNAAKIDALANRLGAVEVIASKFEAIEHLGSRIAKLEQAHDRQEGASGLWKTMLHSPALGWLVGAAVTAWAILTGRLTP
jgi:hypothetical protein